MRKLFRSRRDAVIGGVCGGLGDYWGIDPVIIRLVLVFSGVLTAVFPLAVIYLIMWVIIPLEPVDYVGRVFSRLYRARYDRRIAGVCGGVAQFFNIDSTIVRLIVVTLGLVTAVIPMMSAYLVGWVVIPQER